MRRLLLVLSSTALLLSCGLVAVKSDEGPVENGPLIEGELARDPIEGEITAGDGGEGNSEGEGEGEGEGGRGGRGRRSFARATGRVSQRVAVAGRAVLGLARRRRRGGRRRRGARRLHSGALRRGMLFSLVWLLAVGVVRDRHHPRRRLSSSCRHCRGATGVARRLRRPRLVHFCTPCDVRAMDDGVGRSLARRPRRSPTTAPLDVRVEVNTFPGHRFSYVLLFLPPAFPVVSTASRSGAAGVKRYV